MSVTADLERRRNRFTGWVRDAEYGLKVLWVNGFPVRAKRYDPERES